MIYERFITFASFISQSSPSLQHLLHFLDNFNIIKRTPSQFSVCMKSFNLRYKLKKKSAAGEKANMTQKSQKGTKIKAEPSSQRGVGSKMKESTPPYEIRNFQLHKLLAGTSAENYKKVVEIGVDLLRDILDKLDKTPLVARATGDIERWIKDANKILPLSKEIKTIIGVVGNTGSGKSCLINAILDEERLIPTSTVRACTAVVTEISYNRKYPDFKYAADVEFITKDEWAKELKVLFDDFLMGGGGNTKKETRNDTDAGIAWRKISSVYPEMTKDKLKETTLQELLDQDEVKDVLGTTKVIQENDVGRIYDNLQRFIDSKEKRTREKKKITKQHGEDTKESKGKPKDNAKEKPLPREIEYWPLIRVVKIYVIASVLETGAIIVDLPGVHDSNEARANVAKNYLKNCSGLWIVAPIIRAVDDKAAKDLLGEQFKRQLQMDGGYSQVTFICSKTDDISVTEAIRSLPHVSEKLEAKTKRFDTVHEKILEQQRLVKKFKQDIEGLNSKKDAIDDSLDMWGELQKKAEAGQDVYSPIQKKRKRGGKDSSHRSKRRRRDTDSDEMSSDEDNEILDDSEEATDPLTLATIEEKLQELKDTKMRYRGALKSMKEEKAGAKDILDMLKDEEQALEDEISITCIQQRNIYSREAIRQDFARGLEELERETAEAENEDTYNPEDSVRNYDDVANNLPVFCISSRGYQKLNKRLSKDANLPFTDVNQTEVPQLKAHCRAMTDVARIHGWEQFATQLSLFLNTLGFSAAPMSNRSFLDAEGGKMAIEMAFQLLSKNAMKSVDELDKALELECDEAIYSRCENGVNLASGAALDTTVRWGSKVNRENPSAGGFFWNTYRALCGRDGVFTGFCGHNNMNEQLLRPLLSHVTPDWDSCFSRHVPEKLSAATKAIQKGIQSLHDNAVDREKKLGGNAGRLHALDSQVQNYSKSLEQLRDNAKSIIQRKQKDANRQFEPLIGFNMKEAYEQCSKERGQGCFARMKDVMAGHVSSNKTKMFTDATEVVQQGIEDALEEAIKLYRKEVNDTLEKLKHNYQACIGTTTKKPTDKAVVELEKVLEVIRNCLEVAYRKFGEEIDTSGKKEIEDVFREKMHLNA